MSLENLVGKGICGYRVEKRIDETNFSIVYEAVSDEIGKKVVVKQPKSHSLVEEGRVLAKLNHPNIEQVINYDSEHNCLVLERAEGIVLEDYLKQRKEKLTTLETIKIIRQVLEGLSYVHSHGIIHRDLHPKNVVISNPVKIIDFGLANREEPSYDLRLSFGAEKKDKQFDIHCVGMLMYQMAGNNEDLKEVIRRATSVIKEERYKSAGEMLRDLTGRRETEKRIAVFLEHKPAAIETMYGEIALETIRAKWDSWNNWRSSNESDNRERIEKNALRRAGELNADAAIVEDYTSQGGCSELIRFYKRKPGYHLGPGEIDTIKELQEAKVRKELQKAEARKKARERQYAEWDRQIELNRKRYYEGVQQSQIPSKNPTHSSLLARLKKRFLG